MTHWREHTTSADWPWIGWASFVLATWITALWMLAAAWVM